MDDKKLSGADDDIYSRMYDEQLEKFENMRNKTNSSGAAAKPVPGTSGETLHFYSEEELAAVEQARRDAAMQAYQDAYREQYSMAKKQYSSADSAGERRRKMKSSSQQYGGEARRKTQSKRIEFGERNSYDGSGRKKKGKKGMKKRSGGSAVGSVFKGIFIIILIVVILIQLLIFRYISMVNSVDTGSRLVTNASMSDSAVTNILLIGSDTRDEDEAGRTDSMILLSFNRDTKEITMTSFMRDSYVEIPGYGWSKLNAAYVYGGAELLMDTIEQNFDVEVEKYVYVSFYSFIDIVDAAGGIELDISDEEAAGMTDPLAEQNKYLGNESGTDYLTSGGSPVTVNGNQALAYARLRYVGNADFERTSRQRTVITQIIAKAKTLSLLDLDSFLKTCASELTTNMTKAEMYVMFYRLIFSMNYETEELQIPSDGAYSYGTHDGASTLDPDFDVCRQDILETIYN